MWATRLAEYGRQIQGCFAEVEGSEIRRAEELLRAVRQRDGTLFVLGNGGSAATASHMAIDFEKFAGMRVVSLTNVSNITAWANDVGYDVVFSEQLKRHLRTGDAVIAISASGNSPNVLRAVELARERGVSTIGFIGFGGGKLKDMVDVALVVSSRDYGVVEDFHLSLNHVLSQQLKDGSETRTKTPVSWIGVDFDGTLATSITKEWDGPIGEPIVPMIKRVQEWLAQGIEVRIFTARVSPRRKDGSWIPADELSRLRERIEDWCEKHVGKRLECTCQKDHNMIQLWDDKAVQVIRDTGERA